MVSNRKMPLTVEDVDFLLGSHFEGTPYDPYGTQGTEESRHRYRPIGINRTGHMVAMQIRPYAPVESRSIMWISYGSGAFTTSAPFYANVDDTPAYLRDTTPEVSTDCLYWTNRLIATLADAHFYETSNAVEGFEHVRFLSHTVRWNVRMMRLRLVGRRLGLVALVLVPVLRLAVLVLMSGAAVDSGSDGLASPTSVPARLAAANDEMAEYLRSRNTKLLATCCTRPAIDAQQFRHVGSLELSPLVLSVSVSPNRTHRHQNEAPVSESPETDTGAPSRSQ